MMLRTQNKMTRSISGLSDAKPQEVIRVNMINMIDGT